MCTFREITSLMDKLEITKIDDDDVAKQPR